MMHASIRSAGPRDAAAIAAIYAPFVLETCVSFETEPVAPAGMARRIADTQDAGLPWLVAEAAGQVVAYAYATRWRARPAYARSVECTVYVDQAHVGRGIGPRLYSALLDVLRRKRMHTVIGGIALPNAASVALHERLGFRKVAHFEQVGYKHGRWVDVGFWQRLLDPEDADQWEPPPDAGD